MSKCETTLRPYLLMILKCKVLTLREPKDEWELCRVVNTSTHYAITKHDSFENITYKGWQSLDKE